VPRPAPAPTRGPAERAAAWTVTGPPGHLWSAVVDLLAFFFVALAVRVRARLARRG
jgi:hypothetical protein